MDNYYRLGMWLSFGFMVGMVMIMLGWVQDDPFLALYLSLAIGGICFAISIALPLVARFIARENFPFVWGWFSGVAIGAALVLLTGFTDSVVVEMMRLAVLIFVGAGMTHLLHSRNSGLGGAR